MSGVRVVAGALVRDGTVLAARRVDPSGWEFPGGKVEAGETDEQALARELREELGVDVRVRSRLGESADDAVTLVVFLVHCDAEPRTGADHDELRWLDAAALGTVDWLPLDRVLLPSVLPRL